MTITTRVTNRLRPATVLKTLIALPLLLAMQLAVAQWQPATEITSAPLYKGVPLKVEFRYTFSLGFSSGTPRAFRFRGDGLFARFDEDEVRSIAKRLMSRMGRWESARLNGADARRAVYFANSRFFIMSVAPAVLVIVPHQFMPADFVYSVRNLQDLDPQGLYHKIFDAERARNLHSLLARWDEPDSYWINYLELSSIVPDTAGIEIVSDLWNAPVSLADAVADTRWPFRAAPSVRFPGYLEFQPRPAPLPASNPSSRW